MQTRIKGDHMQHILLTLGFALIAIPAFAQTTVSTITRETDANGNRFFVFAGACPNSGAYHPIQSGVVEIIKDQNGQSVKTAFEAPFPENYNHKGVQYCAYKCKPGYEPIAIDRSLMCVGFGKS
jgi:hypothetical protein